MKRKPVRGAPLRSALAVSIALLALGPHPLPADAPQSETATPRSLTAAERRGKHIFLRGTSASGREIKALFGDNMLEVPASALPCVNCHDFDGTGRPEGGVIPSNITWGELTKPYEVTHPSGRKHPPYTEQLLVRAFTMGVDPAGNTLNTTMPRYRLLRDEASDLVAYLKRIGKVRDPGLTERIVRLGALLPDGESRSGIARTVRSVLEAFFEDVNAGGAIFGRRVELHFTAAGRTPEETAERLRELVEKENVFAVVSAYIEEAEEDVGAVVRELEVPLLGAVTDYPLVEFPLNRFVFYLFPGVGEQARALVEFARQRISGENPQLAVVSPGSRLSRATTKAIEEQCESSNLEPATNYTYASGTFDASRLADALREAGTDGVFFLGTGAERAALLEAADRLEWRPHVFVPGPLIGRTILETPREFGSRVFLSAPTGPGDLSRGAVSEFRDFVKRHGLKGTHVAAQVEAYCAAKLAVEGLRSAGRDVSREKLVAVLEGFYEFDTGLIPKLSFGPNRRIGALGAYVVRVDLDRRKLVPASEWIKLR